MDVVGPVPVKINGRFAITVTDFSARAATPTKVHAGAFGNFGISQGSIRNLTGSFKVSIPKAGFEFDFAAEFGGDGGRIVAEIAPGAFKGYRFVKISEEDLQVMQSEGSTSWTVNWTAQDDRNVG